jgi:UDP-2,3-diacylglucosamine pyrophosphatase LpxH
MGDRLLRLFVEDETTNLKTRLASGQPIEPERLRKLQIALRRRLAADVTFDEQDASGACATAARRMIEAGAATVVIMGHTHLRRDIAVAGGYYLNTGTWADLMSVDAALLEDDDEGRARLVEWLRDLVRDRLESARFCDPTYADVRIDDDGHVVDGGPLLRRHDAAERFA